jgi:hypothetical protein
MSTQVLSAVQSEGVGNSNITLLKKVVIVDETSYEVGRSNNGGAYSYEKELYYFYGTNQRKGVFGYWRLSYESNSSEFTTDSNGVFCDYVVRLDFGIEGLPLFKEQCRSDDERKDGIRADIWDYLVPVTEEEFFFARNCIRYKDDEGDERISWKFNKFEGYHE